MSKANRLLAVMERVRLKRSFTVQELADEFQVSYRTMLRYLEELSTLGVPLYAIPGRKGGFRMLEKNHATYPAEIVHLPRRTYIGYCFQAPYTAKAETELLAPRLWMQLLLEAPHLPGIKLPLVKTALALFERDSFLYYVTVEATSATVIANNMTALSLPAGCYVKKSHMLGLELAEVTKTYEEIFAWARQHNREVQSKQFCMEIYGENFNPKGQAANFDIYVPVMESQNVDSASFVEALQQ
jgi:predicted transcriptional regulator YdeE